MQLPVNMVISICEDKIIDLADKIELKNKAIVDEKNKLKYKIDEYNNLPWYKKIFAENPSKKNGIFSIPQIEDYIGSHDERELLYLERKIFNIKALLAALKIQSEIAKVCPEYIMVSLTKDEAIILDLWI